ncbi:MAG: hypothetical protein ACI4KA_04595 [Oscillospiraceae bacterium]
MINLYIKNGNYSLAITLPSEYLKEELHYADVSFSTPVGGTEDISVTLVPNAEHPVAQTIFDRLLPTDKITAVNELCDAVECRIRETEKAFISQELKGTEAMMDCVRRLEQQAKEEIAQYKELSM